MKFGVFLSAGAVHLDNITNFWDIHELVDQTLTINFRQNSSLVIIPTKRA